MISVSSTRKIVFASLCAVAGFAAVGLQAKDWPQWGGTDDKNMVAPEAESIPTDFDPGEFKEGTNDIDPSSTKKVKWVAKLGSQSYGNPSIANGMVFVGTNNETPRDPDKEGDRGIVMVFDEKTGEFLWQLVVPKLGAGKVSDWEYIGVCSSPAIEGEVAYVTTNRCEVVCLDLNGMKDGNDGPFKDEAKYMSTDGNPVEVKDTDADILWVFDMREELGIFPHNVTSSSPIIVGDMVISATSNGVDWSHTNIPSPLAPGFIALNKKTGELIGEEGVGSGRRLMHACWSSLAYGKPGGTEQLIWGGSDGYAYGFDPEPVEDSDGFMVFKDLWRYDCNPPEYRTRDGKPIKYATPPGPSECIATPVLYKDKVYIAIGQDPEHGDGVGMLSCIDATKRGDISGEEGAIWTYKDVGRTISTVSVYDDLVFIAEYAGRIHCLDAMTGEVYWVHDTFSRIWGSTLVADGKLMIGNEDGDLLMFKAGKEKELLAQVYFDAPIYSSPVVANDTLYVATQSHLYAIGE